MQSRSSRALWNRTSAALCGILVSALCSPAFAVVYDRNAAVAYADKYANYVVSDGWFWVDSGTCLSKGAYNPVPTGSGLASGVGDDCAHFVSCSIGSEPHATGGGLPVPSPLYPTYLQYGNPSSGGITNWVLSNGGVQVSSAASLTPGDIIAYDWNGNNSIDHVVFYRGGGNINAHSTSHQNVAWNWFGNSTYPNLKTTFVHITLPDVHVPTAPANNVPANNASQISLTPTLTGNGFVDTVLGGYQVAAQWQIYKGSSLVFDSGIDTSHLTSLTIPSGKLLANNSYAWKVRYQDNYSGWSTYSNLTSFSTVPEPSIAVGLLGSILCLHRRRRR